MTPHPVVVSPPLPLYRLGHAPRPPARPLGLERLPEENEGAVCGMSMGAFGGVLEGVLMVYIDCEMWLF